MGCGWRLHGGWDGRTDWGEGGYVTVAPSAHAGVAYTEIRSRHAPRAVSFVDGQNLYRRAKDAFGHYHPNYDPIKLSEAVCAACGWTSTGVRFYTGTLAADRSPMWHGYWGTPLACHASCRDSVVLRPIRYRTKTIRLPNGDAVESEVGQEKWRGDGSDPEWASGATPFLHGTRAGGNDGGAPPSPSPPLVGSAATFLGCSQYATRSSWDQRVRLWDLTRKVQILLATRTINSASSSSKLDASLPCLASFEA